MSDLFFVLKSFVVTILIILFLQIKIGGTTLETKSLDWMRESASIGALRGVADGASALIEKCDDWVKEIWRRNVSADKPRKNSADERKRRVERERAWKDEVEQADASDTD